MKKIRLLIVAASVMSAMMFGLSEAKACTGISLMAKDGSLVIGRTMEWGTFRLESNLMVMPRGYTRYAVTPSGEKGMMLRAKYGYAGIAVLEDNFIAEGVNEKGLVGELFYFPGYGTAQKYNPSRNSTTVTDAQFLDWVLCNFATIAEMERELGKIHFVTYGKGFESAHYSLADATGRRVVVEYYDDRFHVHENYVGVITNSPSFDWHVTNLNNYVNMSAGSQAPRQLNANLQLKSLGVGSAALGLPGDLTPPSRFVRAAFYVHTAKQMADGFTTTKQVFQILNNFDLPVGAEFADKKDVPNLLSATQWTTATDIKARKFYYRTEWNYQIRCLDLNEIDFGKVNFQVMPLDKNDEYPIERVVIK